ncbi:MAG TPA: NFACT RNA binding domain-containing protein [Ktedonobacterales bacterium]|nr:NFACT RNA binding domain-containing protein [Ktedonobacterales bacterium]
MQIDALTLAALADEFERDLRGARVDDVIQPTPHSIALQVWGGGRNRWLFISAHPQLAHVRLTSAKPRKLATEPPAFVMLLRKHLEGARIVAARQPAWERVIELGFARGPDVAEGKAATWLIAEVMGRFSNIISTDAERTILGALRLAGAETNQYRAIMPHEPYRTPPPQTRALADETLPQLAGEDVTASDLRDAALDLYTRFEEARIAEAEAVKPARGKRGKRGSSAPTVASMIATSVLGFGRELGREVAARALGAADAAVDPAATWATWEALARETRALATLAERREWRPTLVYTPATAESPERPIALAVYEPRQYPPTDILRPVTSVNDALDLLFSGAEWRVELEQAKGDLRRLLQTQRDRCVRKADALRGEMAAQEEAATLRREADTLLAFQSEVAPGAKTATLPDAWASEEGATLTLTLDPQYSAVENANRRYARYHKLQRAAELLPEQVEANDLELAHLEQLLTDLALAETPAEVSLVRAEVAEAGYIKGGAEARRLAKEQRKGGKKGQKGKASGKASGKADMKGGQSKPSKPEGGAPLRRRLSGDVLALVGKNSRQNEEVTFHQAAPNDLWLHARGAPGSHVILKVAGRPAPDEALTEAASLAGWYSQLREAGSVAVDVTEARYVRHMKGGGPGMVIYERERTVHAPPADAGEPAK